MHQKTILREGCQATEWEKIFTSYINDKELVPTFFYKLSIFNLKKVVLKIWAKYLKTVLSKNAKWEVNT